VRLHQLGLSDRNAVLRISLREDFSGGAETGNAAIVIDNDDSRFECASIPVMPLDDIADSFAIDRLDFVKLDIEGHEDKFLVGARRTIEQFRPIIHMEVNESYYSRRGIDPTGIFEKWQRDADYKAALRRHSEGWTLQTIRERRSGIDDVLFIPSDSAESVIKQLRG
jgi:hypothetical protein